jgi:hypothetical protein
VAVGERCPACGHMHGEDVPGPTLTYEGQLTAWAVELTRASTNPGEAPSEVGSRLRILHNALQGLLHDGPASDPPPAA